MSYVKHEYIGINPYSRPGTLGSGIKGIVMHYTANPGGTARNHKSYFNNLNGVYASAHVFVDDSEALCIIPYNEVAYHANDTVRWNGDGTIYKPMYNKIGNANYSMIGIEMCLDRNGNITETTFQNSVKVAKEIIKQYPHITRDMIVRHFDVTGKNCPASWVAKPSELERFRNAVFSNTEPEQPKPIETKKGAKAMFVYTLKKKNGAGELWGVNGNTRFWFSTKEQYDHYLKIVKANGGDTTTTNVWNEGSYQMKVVELMAPNVSK